MITYYLDNRSLISIVGADAVGFINSLTTNSLKKLAIGEACYNALLNPQSRFLFDFFCYKAREDLVYIDIYSDFCEEFIASLKKYKLRSKIEIKTENNATICIADKAQEGTFFNFKDPRSDNLGIRSWFIGLQQKEHKTNQLEYDDFLIKNGIATGEWMEQGKSFILEYNFEELNGVDFDKGCYIGQELVTRTKRIGEIRKKVMIKQSIEESDKPIKSLSDNSLHLVLSKIK